MAIEPDQSRKQIDELLNLPQQCWLLGAGVSKDAGIPLMLPLTDRVEQMLKGDQQKDFRELRGELSDNSHVEHVLSHIADLIAIASRTRTGKILIGKVARELKELKAMHAEIQMCIRDTMRWGYVPATQSAAEIIGKSGKPIVKVDGHVEFIDALFRVRRANLERRPPVALFTTNYDTLVEDALALSRIRAADGFCGGAMAFWEPDHPSDAFDHPFSSKGDVQAKVYKLHGSIDWFRDDQDVVVRRRDGAGYPSDDPARLLIYPQATKYQVTQKDPFARLFVAFRSALNDDIEGLLVICGYSFGDDHVNEEIERALRRRGSKISVLIFFRQPVDTVLPPDESLPITLATWLKADDTWTERVIVAGSRGFYHGSLENRFPAPGNNPHPWWSFAGVTRILKYGPEVEA